MGDINPGHISTIYTCMISGRVSGGVMFQTVPFVTVHGINMNSEMRVLRERVNMLQMRRYSNKAWGHV